MIFSSFSSCLCETIAFYESVNFDGFVSQNLTPGHKEHKVNMLILNDFFFVFFVPLCETIAFYEPVNIDIYQK